MKAAEDFLEIALCVHVATAAKQAMKTLNVSGDCIAVAKDIVQQFIQVSLDPLTCANILSTKMTMVIIIVLIIVLMIVFTFMPQIFLH